jgi:hypothetical protein
MSNETKEATMGRRPDGERAMTAAERKRRQRGTKAKAYLPWLPGTEANKFARNIIWMFEHWVAFGEPEQIGKWLAQCLASGNAFDDYPDWVRDLDDIYSAARQELDRHDPE